MKTSRPTGFERIEAERLRQISVEGFTTAHDDQHAGGELKRAARSYEWHADTIVKTGRVCENPPPRWPWERRWWKPSPSPARGYEKAGALYLAEYERLERKGEHLAAYDIHELAKACGTKIDTLTK